MRESCAKGVECIPEELSSEDGIVFIRSPLRFASLLRQQLGPADAGALPKPETPG